jgi:toxin ParE1/3/4
MKVHWTDTAQGHLDSIYGYIAQDSVEYALRVVDRLTRRSQVIADFPLSGRRVPEYEMDELREAVEGPYRVIYYIKPDQVDVIAVIHGARDLRAALQAAGWPEQQTPG